MRARAPCVPCVRTRARARHAQSHTHTQHTHTHTHTVHGTHTHTHGTQPTHTQDVLFARPTPPGVLLLELMPGAIEATGYAGGGLRLLTELYDAGYTDVSHSGCVRA